MTIATCLWLPGWHIGEMHKRWNDNTNSSLATLEKERKKERNHMPQMVSKFPYIAEITLLLGCFNSFSLTRCQFSIWLTVWKTEKDLEKTFSLYLWRESQLFLSFTDTKLSGLSFIKLLGWAERTVKSLFSVHLWTHKVSCCCSQ